MSKLVVDAESAVEMIKDYKEKSKALDNIVFEFPQGVNNISLSILLNAFDNIKDVDALAEAATKMVLGKPVVVKLKDSEVKTFIHGSDTSVEFEFMDIVYAYRPFLNTMGALIVKKCTPPCEDCPKKTATKEPKTIMA